MRAVAAAVAALLLWACPAPTAGPQASAGATAPASPLVVVVLFTDLVCPHCARAEGVMARITETWPEDVQVRRRHLPLPFHPRARPAAIAVEAAARQGARERLWRRLQADVSKWPTGAAFTPYLAEVAAGEGLDPTRFAEDMADEDVGARVTEDMKVAGLLDVNATPTVWVNGLRVKGIADFSTITPVLRAELSAARGMARAGSARSDVPTARTRTNMGDDRRAAWLLGLEAPPKSLPGTAAGGGVRPAARKAASRTIPDDARWAVPIDATSPATGSVDNALVTIVLFEDLASAFSKRLQPTLDALLTRQGEDVRLTYRHLPLPHNPDAMRLAHAAHCAHEQGQFWAMRDGLLTTESPSTDALVDSLNMDRQAFDDCLASTRPALRVGADAGVARRVAVGGTPVLFVNGRKTAGARPLEELEALVNVEREGARARLAAQAKPRKRSSLHDAITRHGRARIPLSPVPTAVAEIPAATLGAEASPVDVQAWLDLSDEAQRQSLKTLVSAARDRKDLHLSVFPARPGEREDARAWQRAIWCAVAQDKTWPLLDAAAALVRHTHGDPMENVHDDHATAGAKAAGQDGHRSGHAGAMRTAGLALDACADLPIRPATFPGPTWLVNGRKYDGSMGWGPPALRRLSTLVTTGP